MAGDGVVAHFVSCGHGGPSVVMNHRFDLAVVLTQKAQQLIEVIDGKVLESQRVGASRMRLAEFLHDLVRFSELLVHGSAPHLPHGFQLLFKAVPGAEDDLCVGEGLHEKVKIQEVLLEAPSCLFEANDPCCRRGIELSMEQSLETAQAHRGVPLTTPGPRVVIHSRIRLVVLVPGAVHLEE